MEDELLRLRGADDEVLDVAVDLRSDDEGDIGIAEEAEEALGEVRQGNVVGIDRQEDVVVLAMGVEPGVVVAVLATSLVRSAGEVPALDAAAREVAHADPLAQLLDLRVVALVEQPDVEGAVVADLQRRLDRRPDRLERLGP